MRAEQASFAAICEALRGAPPRGADWDSLLALANRTLTTPALAAALAGRGDIPRDVTAFLATIAERARQRHAMMHGQLGVAVAALAAAGVTPILIKGAAFMADGSRQPGDRICADLDLMIPFDGAEAAVAALEGLGYARRPSAAPPDVGLNLARGSDAGGLDLHFCLPSLHRYCGYDDLAPRCRAIAVGEAQALLPSHSVQAALLVAHDEIQERGYWRGSIDLRHLHDIAASVAVHGPLDAEAMQALFPDRQGRRILASCLLTLETVFAIALPSGLQAAPRARLQARRKLWQVGAPWSAKPLTLASLLVDFPRTPASLRSRETRRKRAQYYRRMFEPPKPTKV
ncbi:nucleotidyltransferase family protein [Qipengyuania sp. 6B39]|uniref:nucleotidyltransferase family protein n=1 Tax=Qipengyuania proteolytica TaxID=2867239 RepID=UPI001C894D58|nr:nucleotidyltransferase family protein [Qipengyuania proteolytica]MBX7496305.1 nucleotidyltransferase family protein [Qipengyuania proteolytica]